MEIINPAAAQRRWPSAQHRIRDLGLAGLIGLGILLLPVLLPPYLTGLVTKLVIFAIFAMGFNLIFGYTGLISLGHAAFFGIGGYTAAILMVRYGINSAWVGMVAGVIMSGLAGAVLGIVALRVTGLHFLLVTFALGQLLYSVAWNWSWLSTPGMQGLIGITFPSLGLARGGISETSYFYLVLLSGILCFCLIKGLIRSPFGYSLQGIREGEHRMLALGYNTWAHKYIAFIISAGVAGLAGVLFAYYNKLISPTHLGVETSFLVMAMTIIGGAGTLFGPVIGAAGILLVQYFANTLVPQRWPLILGGLFVAAIMAKVRHKYGATGS